MFSIMTIASSTTKPVEIVNAISVRLFRLYPSMYITPNVPTSESGTAMLGIIVAERLRRKRKIIITTSATVSTNSNCTSATEARIVLVRSVSTLTCTSLGSVAVSCGSNDLVPSTTEMMLAPGCRCMFMMTAGTWSIHAAWRTSSTPSFTLATSVSLTGAPLRKAMTSGAYCALESS